MAYDIGLMDLVTMQAVINAEQQARNAMKDAWDAYNGLLLEPLKVKPGDLNDNVMVNIIAPIVDANTYYLFGEPFDFDLPGGEIQPDDTPAEKWLRGCLAANNVSLFLHESATNGSVCGTPFYRIDTTRRLANHTGNGQPFPRFHVVDPTSTYIVVDDMDIDLVLKYVFEYNTSDPKTKQPIKKRQVAQLNDDMLSWTIIDQHSRASASFVPSDWITDSITPWPYPWAPYGHCKNLPNPNEVYGKPDVTETLIKANNAINFNLSNRNRIDKHHSHPIIYLIGYNGDVQKLNMGPGQLLNVPGGWMGNNPQIGQLVPSVDGQASALLGREVYEYALEETFTPSAILGRADAHEANDPSGTALRMKYGPILKKTEAKRQATYGPWLSELFRRLLELGGYGADMLPKLDWPELVPNDPLLERQAYEADLRMGIASVETISSKAGYQWQIEKDKIAQEKQDGVYPNLAPNQGGAGGQNMSGPQSGAQSANSSAHAAQMGPKNNGMMKPNDN